MTIERVPIDIHIPFNEVRIVAMQPFVKFQSPINEPFKWSTDVVESQINAITRTLDLAQTGFGEKTANFTLFPEYAIPGLAGAEVIDNRINNETWTNESVIIAGVDGLNKEEYNILCQELAVSVTSSNAPSLVPNGQWVNCCIIWIKDQNGMVHKWVQPKIKPSWPEMAVTCNDMFHGSTVYIFEAKYTQNDFPCNFLTLICYDWVAADSGTTVCNEVLNQLNIDWSGTPTPLHWVFVVQHNPKPNHQSFLNSTCRFFDNTDAYYNVERRDAVVLHANTAVSAEPSRSGCGGFTACVFSPSSVFDCKALRPTVNMQPEKLRGNNTLLNCKDVVFREMGECIHLFKVRVPKFVGYNVNDRTYPILDAKVYSTSASVTDPRLPGSAVPAVVKWINDSLDHIYSLGSNDFQECDLFAEVESIQPAVISEIRNLEGHTAAERINWATCSFNHNEEPRNHERQVNADLWDEIEMDALEHIIHSLTLLRLSYVIDIVDTYLHGTLFIDTVCVQIVLIKGETYTDCRHHYDNFIRNIGTDPILVIARDRNNLRLTDKECLRFYETDVDYNMRFIDYQRLVTCCREAKDKETLRGCLDEFIPRDRRII